MEDLIITDFLILLSRWKKLFFATAIVLLAVTLPFALKWSTYRSTATVQVEQSQVSAAATAPMGSNPYDRMEALADKRISVLQQKVLSTSSLVEIITKFNLYAKAREKTPISNIADGMRRKILVNLVSSSLANPSSASKQQLSAIAFTISFDYSNPLVTQQVTDELVTRFLNEDLMERRVEAQKTTSFLADQIDELEKTLSEQERVISDYQKEHGVSRPETLAFNQQAAENLTLTLQSLNSQIATVEGTLGSLRAQIVNVDPYSRLVADGQILTTPSVQLKALQSQYAALTAQYGQEHPDVVKVRNQIAALQSQVSPASKEVGRLKAQITDLRTNLETAEKTLGQEHPDVLSLRNQLHNMEDQLAYRKTQPGTPGGAVVGDADNPVYLQLVAQIKALEEQDKALLEQRKELGTQQQRYLNAIIDNPESVKELASLSRDYENAKMRYRELKAKKMSADMDEKLQKDRMGERLSLINPPELPLHTQPRRLLLVVASLFFSFFGGLGSVFVLQILSPRVFGPRHLEYIVGVAPLVTVPHIYTHSEKEHTLRFRVQREAQDFLEGHEQEFEPYVKRFLPVIRPFVAGIKKIARLKI